MENLEREEAIRLYEVMWVEMSDLRVTDEVLDAVAKNCALNAIDERLDLIRYHGTDIGVHSLLFGRM